MNTISCNIIQDLIPLYIENMVSEDSKTLVEEHIAHCENCRIAVETMQRPVTRERDRMHDMKPLQAIKKRITALVTVAVLLTANWHYIRAFRRSEGRLQRE